MDQNNINKEPFGLDEQPQQPNWATQNNKLLAGLSYVSQLIVPAVLPVVLLLTPESKREPLVRYHAAQSLALLIAAVIFEIVIVPLVGVLASVFPPLACVLWVLPLAPFFAAIYYGWMGFRGDFAEVPWLTAFMKKNGWL